MNTPRDDRHVDDFFDAHRARIVEHDADEETWEAIRARARDTQHRSRGMWFLGGAVAASAAAVVGVLVFQGMGDPGAQPAPPAGAPQTTVDAGPVTQGPTTSAPDVPTGPGSFVLPAPDLSVPLLLVKEPTGEESELRTAVAAVSCPMTTGTGQDETVCPELAVSEDEGRTWVRRVDMSAAGYHDAVSSRGSTWMWPDVGDSRDEGLEPGSRLVRSDDGGRTWRAVPTRGDAVLAVETFRSTLVVVTSGCDDAPPQSCVEVVITDVSTDDATTGRRTVQIDLPGTFVEVPGHVERDDRLMATYDAVYLELGGRGTYRIADGEEVATRVDTPGCRVHAAPDSQDSLVSVCLAPAAPITVNRSADGGRSWADVVPPPDVTGTFSVVSNDGTRLVAATPVGIWVTDDDGASWQQTLDWSALGGPDAPDSPWIKAVASRSLQAGDVLRQHEQSARGRWVSDDDGLTWTEQPRTLIPGSLP